MTFRLQATQLFLYNLWQWGRWEQTTFAAKTLSLETTHSSVNKDGSVITNKHRTYFRWLLYHEKTGNSMPEMSDTAWYISNTCYTIQRRLFTFCSYFFNSVPQEYVETMSAEPGDFTQILPATLPLPYRSTYTTSLAKPVPVYKRTHNHPILNSLEWASRWAAGESCLRHKSAVHSHSAFCVSLVASHTYRIMTFCDINSPHNCMGTASGDVDTTK